MVVINEFYGFEKDKHCFTLYGFEKREKVVRSDDKGKLSFEKTGELVTTQYRIGYYSSLEGVLRAAADNAVSRKAESGLIESIEGYLNAYKEEVASLVEAASSIHLVEA